MVPAQSHTVQCMSKSYQTLISSDDVTWGLAIPPWVGAMSTGQWAVMLCDWGVKADMVLFAGNTV